MTPPSHAERAVSLLPRSHLCSRLLAIKGGARMPIYPGSDMSILSPGYVSKCRPTCIRATGTATAYARTATGATREARAEARRLRDKAVRRVRDRGCPKNGGCAAGCQQGRILKIAW